MAKTINDSEILELIKRGDEQTLEYIVYNLCDNDIEDEEVKAEVYKFIENYLDFPKKNYLRKAKKLLKEFTRRRVKKEIEILKSKGYFDPENVIRRSNGRS